MMEMSLSSHGSPKGSKPNVRFAHIVDVRVFLDHACVLCVCCQGSVIILHVLFQFSITSSDEDTCLPLCLALCWRLLISLPLSLFAWPNDGLSLISSHHLLPTQRADPSDGPALLCPSAACDSEVREFACRLDLWGIQLSSHDFHSELDAGKLQKLCELAVPMQLLQLVNVLMRTYPKVNSPLEVLVITGMLSFLTIIKCQLLHKFLFLCYSWSDCFMCRIFMHQV